MDVFYAIPEYVSDSTLKITGQEHHHLSRVMRVSVNEILFVADGLGTMYRVKIAEKSSFETICAILECHIGYNEPKRNVTLVMALLKNPGKMDWIVEKTTELGISRIIPIVTERTQVFSGKIDRWNNIALAAMKQSCRCKIPLIEAVCSYIDVFQKIKPTMIFLFHENVNPVHTIRKQIEKINYETSIALFIGPEGGFTEEEIQIAREHNASLLSLGTRRLRSETAAIVSLAQIIE